MLCPVCLFQLKISGAWYVGLRQPSTYRRERDGSVYREPAESMTLLKTASDPCAATCAVEFVCRVCLAFCLTPVCARGADSLEDRFPSEPMRCWADFQHQTADGTITCSMAGRFDSEEERHTYEFKSNGSTRLVLVRDFVGEGKERETVYCQNSKYAFVLTRRAHDAAWVLESLHIPFDADAGQNIERRLRDSVAPFAPMTHLNMVNLKDIVGQPTFAVTALAYGDRERASGLVKLGFVVRKDADESAPVVQEGTLWLDPDNYWSVREASVRLIGQEGEEGQLEIRIDLQDCDGIPIPRSIRNDVTWRLPNGESSVSNVLMSDYTYSSSAPSKDEFRLTAFGLPEPRGFDEGHSWWLYLALLGAAMICLGYAAFRRSRR